MATSRSLGVLSIDLIAKVGGFTEGMTRAEREADRKGRDIARKQKQSAKETEAAWDKASKAIGAAFAAVSVGAVAQQLFGVAKETANLALEFDKLSQLSGTSSQTFQKLAAGAETVGISAEKLADIFKDVQDKAGDFAQTGGGGMADFFENIAPKVGVTIEQFRRLSGPEALQRYVSSLEKASLSQQDMVFYMEALASDSTMLLPLLRENGAEFNRLGDAAERAGAIMGDDALNAAKAYKDASIELDNAMKGIRAEVMGQLIPALTSMNDQLANPQVQQGIKRTIDLLASMASTVVQLGSEFALGMANANGFWDALFKYGLSNPFKSPEDQLKSLGAELEKWEKKRERYISNGVGAGVAESDKQIRSLRQQINYYEQLGKASTDAALAPLEALGKQGLPSYESLGGTSAPAALSPAFSKPKTGGGGKSEAEKAAEDARRYIDALKKQADQVQKMTAYEKLLYDLREGSVKFSTEPQRKEAEALAIRADFSKDGLELEKERQRLQQEGARLTEQTLSPMEKLAKEQEHINELYAAGSISLETQMRAMDKAKSDAFGISGDVTDWVKGDSDPLSGGLFDNQLGRYDAEAEQEEERYAAQLKRLTTAMEARKYSLDEYYSLFEGMQRTHNARMAQIDDARYQTMLGAAADGFGRLADTMKGTQAEASSVYRALFAVSKAFAIAQASLGLTNAISSAMALPWPANLAAAASAAGYMATIVSNVQGINAGFAEGGYTGAGGKYEVAGVVHKGEGVLSQRDMAALGGVGAFESFRSSLHSGYAEGGAVGYPAAAGYDLNSTAKTESGASKVTVQLIGGEFQGAAIEEDYDAINEETIIRVVSRDFQRRGPMSQVGSQVFGWNRVGT